MRRTIILNKIAILVLLLCINVAALETPAKVASSVERESGQKKFNLLVQFQDRDGNATELKLGIAENEPFQNDLKSGTGRVHVISGILLPPEDGQYYLFFSRADIFEDTVRYMSTGKLKIYLGVPNVQRYVDGSRRTCTVTVSPIE